MQPSILDQINANTNSYGAPALSPDSSSQSQSVAPLSALNSLSQGQSTPVTPAAPQSGNWLTHLLPTIGSIGGGLLGTLTDEFTGPLGTIGGSAAGGGAGKALENLIEGNKDEGSGVLSSTGEGALGGAGGEIAGNLLKGVGGVLASQAGKGIDAADQAVNDAADVAKAQETRNVFGPVPNAIKQGIYDNQSLAGAQKLAGEVGINPNDPQAMVDAANKALEPLSDIRMNAVAAAGPINTAGAIDQTGSKVIPGIDDIINGSLHNAHPLTGESLGQDLTATLGPTDQIAVKGNSLTLPNNESTKFITSAKQILDPVTGNNVDPNDLLNASVKVGQNAQAARELAANTSASDVQGVNAAKAQAWTNLDKSLNDILYNRPEVDKFASTIPGVLTTDDTGGNAALAQTLNNKIGNIQSGNDVNKVMSDFMNLKNQGNAALKVAGDTSSASNLAAVKQAAGMGPNIPLADVDSSGADALGAIPHPQAKLLSKVLNLGNNGGIGGAAKMNLGTTLQRIAPIAGLSGADVAANSPNSVMGQAGAGSAIGQNINQTPTIGSSGNVLQDIMNSTSPNTAALKLDIINAEHRGAGAGGVQQAGIDTAGAQELQQLQAANAAEQQLKQYINLYNQAGGAQGPIGGLLNQLGSQFTGGPAAQLPAQQAQISEALKGLLGSNVNVNLPSIMQNQQSANGVLAQLQSGLGSYGAL